jgi:hypothetical protein
MLTALRQFIFLFKWEFMGIPVLASLCTGKEVLSLILRGNGEPRRASRKDYY